MIDGPGPFGDAAEAVPAIEAFLGDLPRAAPSSPTSRLPPAHLSERQREVLLLIAQGLSAREAAEKLVLSVRTVERHVADAYAKIGARNRAEATAYVLEHLAPEAWPGQARRPE